ncbi:hypothetical protein FZEAL_1932 [Fusarium zealandicum]|uniref:Kelch repeat-containing protein n=1 Tax=Fusarium zealandicum TaxID=1053134 RepID=A0A8H4US80_9HYPO|nr:hypothetical protein FZEAL_1932 [Fusarium zealandicum]
MLGNGAVWALLAAAAGPAIAQFSNWADNQISTEICTWTQPRAAIVRDMVYLDGGDIRWLPRNNAGLILNFNLSTPFNSTTNVTGILLYKALSKARGGEGNSNGAGPNYVDGAMMANDAEFFLYGGDLLKNEDLYDTPEPDEVLGYQAYAYGPDKPLWEKGFVDKKLDKNVTRYIAYGGAVNAPSENLAWYFSGLRSETQGPFFTNDADQKATNVSDTLITLDMQEQLREEWTNTTLPDNVKGRANPEVVWVPVGKKGILVVLGGVVYPEWSGRSHKSSDEEASEKESPEFMQTIDVYDIANERWYKQETDDGPGALARGCAVVAPASDSSSFNIYYYGGFDGIHPTEPFSDAVWALSVPSFTWTKINEGKTIHARAGHKCFMPYPDQMMVFGGYTSQSGRAITCLDKGPVVVFNITSGEWMEEYDPTVYSEYYGVHEKIQDQIGGDAAGGATVTAPASGWATSALGKVFDTEYDTDKITTHWPYGKESSTDRPELDDGNDNNDDGSNSGGSGLPKWVAPVLGVVLGLMLVSGALVVFCLWRRRKIFKNRSSDDGTEDAGMRIISWMRGQNAEKAPTVTTSDDTPKSPEMVQAITARPVRSPSRSDAPSAPAEMDDTQVHEMPDTSPPAELHDTGLSPIEIIQKHSHFAPGPKSRSATNPSYSSFSMGEHASTVSRSTGQQQVSTPDSPTAGHCRITSDISGVSEGDAAQLRNLGASPVSPRSDSGHLPSPTGRRESDILPSPPLDLGPVSPPIEQTPVSPPTGEESPGDDYISAKPPTSPLRKSMFVESEEDMGKSK